MSDDNIRLYWRDLTSTNPFERTTHTNIGRSGSDWGLPQIEWLGVKLEWSCGIELAHFSRERRRHHDF